jgi:hypothetical protein
MGAPKTRISAQAEARAKSMIAGNNSKGTDKNCRIVKTATRCKLFFIRLLTSPLGLWINYAQRFAYGTLTWRLHGACGAIGRLNFALCAYPGWGQRVFV